MTTAGREALETVTGVLRDVGDWMTLDEIKRRAGRLSKETIEAALTDLALDATVEKVPRLRRPTLYKINQEERQ